MTGDRDRKVGVTMYCSSIPVVEHGSLTVRFGKIFYHTRFRIDSKTPKTLPLTNPPMCAHQATPPAMACVAVIEAAPLSTCIRKQTSRKTMAGSSTTRHTRVRTPASGRRSRRRVEVSPPYADARDRVSAPTGTEPRASPRGASRRGRSRSSRGSARYYIQTRDDHAGVLVTRPLLRWA